MYTKKELQDQIDSLERRSQGFYTAGLSLTIASPIVATLSLTWYILTIVFFASEQTSASTSSFPALFVLQVVFSMLIFVISCFATAGGIAFLVLRCTLLRHKINNRKALLAKEE